MKIHSIWKKMFKAVGYGFGITLLFIFSLALLAAYGQQFFEFMDRSPMTGVVLFCIGLVSLTVLFFSGCLKRN